MLKTANVEKILDVRTTNTRLAYSYGDAANSGLAKFAALKDEVHDEDGYLYVRCRAISSRVNKNNDGWPSEELMKAAETFVGRPVFVDHNNDNPKRTRGVIVSSDVRVDEKTSALDPYYSTAPDNHKPPTWIELLIEVDAKTYPKLAKSVRKGDIDSVSMGANIERSVCSVCEHEASTPSEYCSHIKQKGVTFEITSADGETLRKKAYEDCYGVNFFEISFVFDPADTTALISDKVGKTADAFPSSPYAQQGVGPTRMEGQPGQNNYGCQKCGWTGTDARYSAGLNASTCPQCGGVVWPQAQAKIALVNAIDQFIEPVGTKPDTDNGNYIPQSDQVTAPQKVDTLRPEHLCPICRAADMKTDPDGIERCPTCGHVQEPEPLNNPDLAQARDTDIAMDNTQVHDEEGNPQTPVTDGTESVEITPMNPVSPVSARNQANPKGVISDMFTTLLVTESKIQADAVLPAKYAGQSKRPILKGTKTPSDQPKGEKVISDEFTPREAAAINAEVTKRIAGVIEKFQARLADLDKESDRRHIVRSEQNSDGVIRSEEITEETEEKKKAEEEQVEFGVPQVEEQQPAYASVEDREEKLLAAMRLADDAIELGLIEKENKMAFIAEVEQGSIDTIKAREGMLYLAKTAGLGRARPKLSGLRRIPRLAHTPSNNGSGSATEDSNFLWQ